MTEDLNIERRTIRYMIAALNRAKNGKEAAKLLGISHDNLDKYKIKYNIRREPGTKIYKQYAAVGVHAG